MKINRVIYRFSHNQSEHGRVGYIGKDKRWPTRRSLKYRSKQKGCRLLYKALQKYPVEFWKIEVLASGFKSDSELIKAEIFYIKKFDSKNKGYNCTDGGEGSSGWNPTVETRRKQSKAKKGKKCSLEHRQHMSETRQGKDNAFYGKRHTDETKRKLSKKLAGKNSPWWGRKLTVEHKENLRKANCWKPENPKDVIDTYLDGSFSLTMMGVKFAVTRQTISKFLREANVKIRDRYDFIKNNGMSEETKNKISKTSKGRRLSDEVKKRMSEAAILRWVERKNNAKRAKSSPRGT